MEEALKPCFGHKKPHEVDASLIRRFIEAKIAEGLNPATIRILVALLSALFVGLVEDKVAATNPCHGLRSTRRLMKPTHDPRTTPFIEKVADLRRIFLMLPMPLAAYAIGVLGGLRTGEILALRWLHVDLTGRRIHVRESVKGPLKDKDSRVVPILDPRSPRNGRWRGGRSGSSRRSSVTPRSPRPSATPTSCPGTPPPGRARRSRST